MKKIIFMTALLMTSLTQAGLNQGGTTKGDCSLSSEENRRHSFSAHFSATTLAQSINEDALSVLYPPSREILLTMEDSVIEHSLTKSEYESSAGSFNPITSVRVKGGCKSEEGNDTQIRIDLSFSGRLDSDRLKNIFGQNAIEYKYNGGSISFGNIEVIKSDDSITYKSDAIEFFIDLSKASPIDLALNGRKADGVSTSVTFFETGTNNTILLK